MKPELINVHPTGRDMVKFKQLDTKTLISSFHFHDLCELVWIEKSHGKRIVGDHVGVYQENDLILMGPSLPHIWQNDKSADEDESRVKSTVVYFPKDLLQGLTDDQLTLSKMNELVERAERGMSFFGETRNKIVCLLKELGNLNELKRLSSVLLIIDLLLSATEYQQLASISFNNKYPEKDNARINKVYTYLMNNFHRDITLEEVAALCNMTTNSFCRFFKARSQKSLTSFINEIRIGHACKLLKNTEDSITDICFASGYNNLPNFNKFFKEITGLIPSAYRKTVRL